MSANLPLPSGFHFQPHSAPCWVQLVTDKGGQATCRQAWNRALTRSLAPQAPQGRVPVSKLREKKEKLRS